MDLKIQELKRVLEFIRRIWSKASGNPIIKPVLEKAQFSNLKVYFIHFGMILTFSYLLANVASSLSLTAITKPILTAKGVKIASEVKGFSFQGRPNFRDIKKGIIDRNIFNIEGQFPDENTDDDDKNGKEKEVEKTDFDLSAPCNEPSFKFTLVGTLAFNDKNSSVVVIRTGTEDGDVYRIGDVMFDHEDAKIADIQRNKVVINNNGKKECVHLKMGDEDEDDVPAKGKASSKKAGGASKGGESENVNLQSSWVESELGDGFGKIIQSARLVPNTVDNRVNGFKIFAINHDTLFAKIGLQDGDVITQVNEIVMEAEQGFALYQAFLDEREIAIKLLRGGTTPKIIYVHIK